MARMIESTATVSDNIELSTNAEGLERAIAAGDLVSCRLELRRDGLPGDQRAALYCRLGEAFYYRGQIGDALDCARAAFALCPQHEAVADFCAWLFSNCEHHEEAAAAYERLIECRPGWGAGH